MTNHKYIQYILVTSFFWSPQLFLYRYTMIYTSIWQTPPQFHHIFFLKNQPPKEETATATATVASQSTTSDLLMELQRLREATNAALGRSEGWDAKKR